LNWRLDINVIKLIRIKGCVKTSLGVHIIIMLALHVYRITVKGILYPTLL